jgi:hypothetical protein
MTIRCIDQLRGDANAITGLANAPFEHVAQQAIEL